MRFLSRAAAALLIGAAAPAAFVAPAYAQTCVCPPVGAAVSGPVIQAAEPPPPLPEYEQPPMPAPGYHWTPGYWAWNNADYYWVPGVWIEPPRVGVLWTPPYWGFVGGVFLFHAGYWAPHVGFYGGINYGFGYGGAGYEGGRWDNGQFFYNRAVNNLGAAPVTHVYNQPITINNTTINRVSYNGGQGGLQVKPTPEQEQVAAEQHIPATPAQVTHLRTASVNAEQFHSTNQGKPPVAATARPGELKGPGAVPTKAAGAAQTTPAAGQNAPANAPLKGEEKLAPGVKPAGAEKPMNGEKPIKTQEVNAPKGQEKLPAAEKAMGKPAEKPALKPAAVEKPMTGEKPIKTEELNGPKAQEKLPAAEKPIEKPSEKPALKPAAVEKPVQHELGPKGVDKPQGLEKAKGPEKPKGAEKPQGLMNPPAERPIVPAMSGGPPRPGVAQNSPKPGAAERKPPQLGGKPHECGKPGLPACPK